MKKKRRKKGNRSNEGTKEGKGGKRILITAFQNYYDILPIDKEEEEEIKSVVIDEENILERLQTLEAIIK